MHKINIAINTKMYRKHKNMTQQELADKLGVSRVLITKIESGTHTPPLTIYYIAKQLGKTVEQLLESNDIVL